MMDVEADDDGVLAKILVQSGTKDVEVNKPIALLAEEGDDISNLELPKESEQKDSAPPKESAPKESKNEQASSEPRAQPGHVSFDGPVLPSVIRLANQYGIQNAEKEIKGTGHNGMLTKGDVLAYLGKAKSPYGTAKGKHTKLSDLGAPPSKDGAPAKKPAKPLTADEGRSLILDGLVRLTHPAPAAPPAASYEEIVASYTKPQPQGEAPTSAKAALDQAYADLLR